MWDGFPWDFFKLPVGECKIVLTDQGDREQVLLGDAIKWVYTGNK